MIPRWKIRREWDRLKQQLQAIPEAITEPRLQRRHDAAFAAGFAMMQGDVAPRGRVAVVLLYQPKGIAESTYGMLDCLIKKGYAPFVISNAPLLDSDRARLREATWQAMERPNVGYDFGGYRDAIRTLMDRDIVADQTLILNDSIWFPTADPTPLFETLDAVKTGVGGVILRERGDIRFLESYLLAIPAATFRHPAFRAYWSDLKLTSNKYKVIRRGERGFSQAMLDAGLPLIPAYPNAAFLDALAEQSDDFLIKTLRYSAHMDAGLAQEARVLQDMAPDVAWRARVLAHCRSAIPRAQSYSCFPYAMSRLQPYPILKRSGDRVAVHWRAAYLDAVTAHDLPAPPDVIHAELRCKVAADMA